MALWDRIKNVFIPDTRATGSGPASLGSGSAAEILGLVGSNAATKSALYGLPAFYACVKVIAETIASLSVGVYERTSDGSIIEQPDHPLSHLIKMSPSNLYSSFTFRETQEMNICSDGNAYTRMHTHPGSGELMELELISPTDMSLYYDKSARKLTYKINNEPILAEDLLHVPAMALDGLIGVAPITAARKTFLLSLAAREYAHEFYNKGTFPSAVLAAPNSLSEPARERMAKSFKQAYSGMANIGNVVLLEEGVTFTPVSLNPLDAAFIEVQKLQLEEIARMYRIPLHMVGDLDRSTNNNIEQQSIDFVVHTVRPRVKRWENEINRKAFNSKSEKNLFFRYNLDSLLRGDSQSRAKFYTAMVALGALNPNEVRALENLNPREGGDEYFVSANLIDPLNDPNNNNDGTNNANK